MIVSFIETCVGTPLMSNKENELKSTTEQETKTETILTTEQGQEQQQEQPLPPRDHENKENTSGEQKSEENHN